MSMSIPIFFKPWRWRSELADDRSEHLIVDGGVLSNFPVWLFDSEGEPPWPTFGLMLVEPGAPAPGVEPLSAFQRCPVPSDAAVLIGLVWLANMVFEFRM